MLTRDERKEVRSQQRREQILDAALDIFSTKGFAAASTAEIAKTAGIAEGTIYNYYRSKREVLIAAIERSVMSQPFVNLVEHAQEMDYPTLLTHILENRLSLLDDSANARMLLMISEILRDPELKDIYRTHVVEPIMTRMEKMFEAKAASGYFRPMDTRVATRAVGGMILGMMLLRLLEGEDSPLKTIPHQKLAADMATLVLEGIRND